MLVLNCPQDNACIALVTVCSHGGRHELGTNFKSSPPDGAMPGSDPQPNTETLVPMMG